MRSGWEKMTRWAGIGNNRGEGLEMVDEVKDGIEGELTPGEASGPVMVADEQEQGNAELEQLREERDGLRDRLARLQAEFDNARKRAEKERQDAREYTIGSTIEPFLGVMDNFQLALKAQGSAEQLRAGVELILKQMETALEGLSVTPIPTVGTQFDPRVHEALASVETAEYPDHQVLEEIRRGYRLREKTLRPAMVKIANNTAQVSD